MFINNIFSEHCPLIEDKYCENANILPILKIHFNNRDEMRDAVSKVLARMQAVGEARRG